MTIRTLVGNQSYFGLEPMLLRRGVERVLQRFAAIPREHARVTVATLRVDFQLDTAAAHALMRALLKQGLLALEPNRPNECRLTERFRELTLVRIVPPLGRARAKELIEDACRLAAQINADEAHNPLFIEMMALSGTYMSRSDKIGEIVLWPVVKPRSRVSSRRHKPSMGEIAAAAEIRGALRALSSFLVLQVVSDTTLIERPFSVPFRAEQAMPAEAPPAPGSRLRAWGSSIRRQLGRR